jgi:hypothetical protein
MISKKIECYAIHRANMPQNGCKVQCKECAEVQQNKMQNVPEYFFSYYQPLFDHMSQQHGLTLLQGEMDEILRVVREISEQPDSLPFEFPVKEGYEVVTRDGRKVEQLVMMDGITDPLLGVIDGVLHRWDKSGSMGNIHVGNDLFLRRKEKKVWVVEWPDGPAGPTGYQIFWKFEFDRKYVENLKPNAIIYEATLKLFNQQS